MKHYVLLHRRPNRKPSVEGVFHEPTEPMALARGGAASQCRNMDFYAEEAGAPEALRVTYAPGGECFVVVEEPPRVRGVPADAPKPKPTPPFHLREEVMGRLREMLYGEWEMVDALIECDVITREVPGSPFLGKFPGPNLFYSLHLRLNEEARAQLNLTDDDRAQVRAALEADGE